MARRKYVCASDSLRPGQLDRLIDKIKDSPAKKNDTGGGCSICGRNPAVNIEGTYWLCGPCVNEYYEPIS